MNGVTNFEYAIGMSTPQWTCVPDDASPKQFRCVTVAEGAAILQNSPDNTSSTLLGLQPKYDSPNVFWSKQQCECRCNRPYGEVNSRDRQCLAPPQPPYVESKVETQYLMSRRPD